LTFTSIETIAGGLVGRDVHQIPPAVAMRAAAAELHFHLETPLMVYLGTS
jgi:hypothetical protein